MSRGWSEDEASSGFDRSEYKAGKKDIQTGRRTPARLEIIHKEGVSLLPYGYLVEILCDAKGQNLTLFFSGIKFSVTGSGLRGLLDSLRNEKIAQLCPLPVGAQAPDGEPVITSIERVEPKK